MLASVLKNVLALNQPKHSGDSRKRESLSAANAALSFNEGIPLPVRCATTGTTASMEFATINSDSNWPTTNSAGFSGFGSTPSSCTGGRFGNNFEMAAGTSLLANVTIEKETPRTVSVRIGLPSFSHFLCRATRLVFNDSLLVFASSSKRNPGECSSLPFQL